MFELYNVKNKGILRDFLNFQVDNIKNEAIPRDFVQYWKVELSKVMRLPWKSDASSHKVLHMSFRIILANLKIWCAKMQPFSGNQRPDLLTSLMNMSLVLHLPRDMHLCRSSWNFPRLPSFLEMPQNSQVSLTFDKVHNPLRLPRKTTSERPKVLRTPQFFALLTSKCASLHNTVHFFDISTSKSAPRMVCFVHFDFEMCFAPQQRALFRHRNCQKCSKHEVLLAFSLPNVLRATPARHVSSLIWPHGSARAALASLLFDPLEPQIIGKMQSFATFLTFRAPASSSDSFSSLIFLLLLFSLLTLATSAFSSVHIVGSLTSKPPSNKYTVTGIAGLATYKWTLPQLCPLTTKVTT